VLAIVFGVLLRLWNIHNDPALWLDEVFSAQVAESPLRDLLLAIPRFDTHPPLYYVQLHFWSLLGDGDRWMLLNSVVLDVLVMLSLFHIAGRHWGRDTGLWVAAVYAVLPLNVFFAQNLRMYAQFFLLVVWLWHMLELRVGAGNASAGGRIGTLLLGLATTLTHGMGFFVVFFVYLQALVRIWRGHRASEGLRPAALLVLDYLPVALAAGYSLGIGSFRRTEGMANLDFASLGIHLTISLFGMEFPVPVIAGYLGVLLLLVPLLWNARAREVLLWMVLLPAATLLLLSLTVKSVFMYRTVGLFSPFMAMAMGIFYAGTWRPENGAGRGRLLSLLSMVVLILASLNSSLSFRKEGYRDIATLWDREASPQAVLFVNGSVNLWGIARYLPGAPRISALDVQPPPREGMLALKRKLEGGFFDRAGLFGQTDHLQVGQRQIWPYVDPARLETLSSYWVLDQARIGCARSGDRVLREFAIPGKWLGECGPAGN
ncbi:MAG: glycosyltransferase family 39 protein, partial [Pseudodonghicola sp.]